VKMPTTQSSLDSVMFETDVYNTQFQPIINSWTQPRCPGSYNNKSEFYDMATHKCLSLPRSAFTPEKLAASASACGGGKPFKLGVEIDGKVRCFDTNTAPSSSWYPNQALNTQQIPVRHDDLLDGRGVCGTPNWRR